MNIDTIISNLEKISQGISLVNLDVIVCELCGNGYSDTHINQSLLSGLLLCPYCRNKENDK